MMKTMTLLTSVSPTDLGNRNRDPQEDHQDTLPLVSTVEVRVTLLKTVRSLLPDARIAIGPEDNINPHEAKEEHFVLLSPNQLHHGMRYKDLYPVLVKE